MRVTLAHTPKQAKLTKIKYHKYDFWPSCHFKPYIIQVLKEPNCYSKHHLRHVYCYFIIVYFNHFDFRLLLPHLCDLSNYTNLFPHLQRIFFIWQEKCNLRTWTNLRLRRKLVSPSKLNLRILT